MGSEARMKGLHLFFIFFTLLVVAFVQFPVEAAPPAGPLIKHVSSLLKWTRTSSKLPQSDGNVLQFEDGYLVETVARGNELGVMPYKIRVSHDGELFAVDADKSNIVKITPPLSQYSRGRLVAGSFQGYTGHVDGKPNEARFSHPKGVTMDDKGNVYVADTSNLAIRKIGESGVTTIAGGKSNVPGYRDGPSEDAKFSSDFDVIYVRSTCSLLVVDRGNAALRQISLAQEDCDYRYSSVSATDILMVIGAVVIGYVSSMLQQGFGSSFLPKMAGPSKNEKVPSQLAEPVKEDQEAVWPSFGQLLSDLSKLAFEALGNILVYIMPFRSEHNSSRNGLTPLKDSLIMPEDEAEPQVKSVQKQRTPAPMSESRHAFTPTVGDKSSEVKPPKIRSSSLKDPSLSTKHKSSRRQEYSEYYASGEVPPYTQVRTKSQKERTKHRHRDKSGEVTGSSIVEPKAGESKPADYGDAKYDHYNMRSKYGDAFRFQGSMGCAGSSQSKGDGTGTVKKIRKPKPWKHPQPITKSQLVQLREEFWDTAPHYGGRKGNDGLRFSLSGNVCIVTAIF
ncbi:OLC1v1023279C1 [Oldenlandia corymbosa var. corymbosa]|uniref:OLC1v1023279C1 n=1 Tax=Oldenlandia corymbosa var. corymbosa TaxID=529605 RepID=A0AAV1C0H0_OLDCO|nr:OLC1v1023279C1 [Oldenlandia corymbosa var. corymbosa]